MHVKIIKDVSDTGCRGNLPTLEVLWCGGNAGRLVGGGFRCNGGDAGTGRSAVVLLLSLLFSRVQSFVEELWVVWTMGMKGQRSMA